MEIRKPSSEHRSRGQRLIESESLLAYILNSSVKIEYLESDKEKTSQGREVFAECERIPAKYRWAIPFDFTITVFQPNAARFNDEQMDILMLHELLHIGIEKDGNEETYRVVPHDVEDFRVILERHGLDWNGQAREA